MLKIFTSLFLSITLLQLQAQISVSGIVNGSDGKALAKAYVSLTGLGSKDTLRTITNNSGNYNFNNVKATKAYITISHVGYKKFADYFDYTNETDSKVNNDVYMTAGDNMLETVTLESSKIQIKEDTVAYKIDSTMYRKNDNVEEVLKKLPGVEVDKEGKVTAQGKEVTKVKVNGKEFFGGDVTTATRQLNADMVDKIQIIDDYGDQAAFTGVKSGDPTKTLNIQLKKDRNKGIFGHGTAGLGTMERYLVSTNLNYFNDNQQISFNGNINNTNANTFDFSRLPGGVGAVAAIFRGNNGGNNGISVTKNFGINYRDQLSKKVAVNGSYSFATKKTETLTDIYQEFPNAKSADSSIFNNQTASNLTYTDNHRFDFNVEYTIDSANYIKFQPGFTFRKLNDTYLAASTNLLGNQKILNTASNSDLNKSTTPNFNGTLLFNHRFKKKGRSLSLNLTGANNYTDGNDEIFNILNTNNGGTTAITNVQDQLVIQNNNNYNYGITASFNEQLSKKNGLEFNYSYNKRFVENDRETFNELVNPSIIIPTQTNIFENIYTTNRFGFNFRKTLKKYNYAIGLGVQPATIESNTLTGTKLKFKQNITNYFPQVRFAYNFSKSKSFNLNYNGNTNQPTYQQSQPIPDVSNPQNTIFGNQNLRPEFSNTFSARYNNFNLISGDVFFSNVTFTFTNDKIVNNVITKASGARETRYLNTNGFYNLFAFYQVSKPLQNRKYVFNYGGNIVYNNFISFLDNLKNNGKNWVITQRFSFDYKVKKWLETSAGANYNINEVNNSLVTSSNNSITTWALTHNSRIFFPLDIVFSYDLTKTLNVGFTNNVAVNPFIANATLEKSFLKSKNASIRVQGFDIFNENTNVSRVVNPSNASITDTRVNRLQRYFMLSFVYRFNKFAGASKSGPGMQSTPPPPGMGGMRMMGGPAF
jgi:hypothetical protein